MLNNKNSLYLLKKDFLAGILVIAGFIALMFPIYFQCSNVIYDNIYSEVQNNIEIGAELIDNEADMQSVVLEKLKLSREYNTLCKLKGIDSPAQYVTMNAARTYYSDLCAGLLIQDRSIALFKNNDIMLDGNSAVPEAGEYYGYSWAIENFTYEQLRDKLFEKRYYGEFSDELKFIDNGKQKLVYIKTVVANFNDADGVVISVFDPDTIIAKCGLDEISEYTSVYLYSWDDKQIYTQLNSESNGIRIEKKLSSVPLKIVAEVSDAYVSEQMRKVRNILLVYIAAAVMAVGIFVSIFAYRHWKMVSEIAEVFSADESLEDLHHNVNYKFIKDNRIKIEDQRRKMSDIVADQLFASLLSREVSAEELETFSQAITNGASDYCLMMIKLPEYNDEIIGSIIDNLYENHINVLIHTKAAENILAVLIDADSASINYLKKLMDDMIYNSHMKIKVVASRTEKLGEITEISRKLKNLLTYLENSVFVVMDELKRDNKYEKYISFEYTRKLYDYIMSGNMRLAIRLVYEQWYYLAENPSVTDEISKLFYWQCGVISQTAEELGCDNIAFPHLGYDKNINDTAQSIIGLVEKLSEFAEKNKGAAVDRAVQIIRYIEENCFNSQFCMQSLIDRFSLSERTIADIIKNKTGMRFTEYISELRIKRVEKLLVTTDIPINDIAELCGFASNNTLYKAFKRVHSISPSQYREDAIRGKEKE